VCANRSSSEKFISKKKRIAILVFGKAEKKNQAIGNLASNLNPKREENLS